MTELDRSRRSPAFAACFLILAGSLLALATPTASAVPEPHEWTPLELIYGDSLGRMNPQTQIGEDALGNRVAVWYDFDGSMRLFAATAPAGGKWTPPIPIDSGVEQGILGFDLAVSTNGNAAVAWLSWHNLLNSYDRYSVEGAFFYAGSGWTYADVASAVDIADSGNPGRASAPAVDIDETGEAVAVWTQTTDYLGTNETDVYAARHAGISSTWTSAVKLDTLAGTPDRVDVACAEGGIDTAVWRQVNGTNTSLFSATYTTGGGWAPSEPRENSSENLDILNIEAGAPGQLVLAWTQGPSGATSVYASTFSDGSWKSPEMIDGVADPHGEIKLAANAGGAAVAWWSLITPPNYSIRGSAYDPASGWRVAEYLVDDTPFPFGTRPGIDASGDGLFLLWGVGGQNTVNVLAQRYVNGTGWLAGEVVLPAGNAPEDLVVSPDGHASGAIRHFDGTIYRPYEIQYLPSDVSPPALTLDAPGSGAAVSSPFVAFHGSTEPLASVTVAGAPVFVGADGKFDAIVELPGGESSVAVIARDAAGNAATLMVTVNVTGGPAALEARMDMLEIALNDSIGALESSLATLSDVVNASSGGSNDALWQSLNETGARLAALEANVSALRAAVGPGSEPGTLSARVEALETSIIAARAELNTTTATAAQAGSVANRAEAGAGSAIFGLAAGVVGALLGAVALLRARPRKPSGPTSTPEELVAPKDP